MDMHIIFGTKASKNSEYPLSDLYLPFGRVECLASTIHTVTRF